MKRPIIFILLLTFLNVAWGGFLRGTVGGNMELVEGAGVLPGLRSPTPAPTLKRALTGALQNREDHVQAVMPSTNPSGVEQVGAPALQTMQGEEDQAG
jgi:hypothetical protein